MNKRKKQRSVYLLPLSLLVLGLIFFSSFFSLLLASGVLTRVIKSFGKNRAR